jgi:predicted phosphodiesterase
MSRTDVVALPESKTRIVVLGDPHGDLIGLVEVLEREERPSVQIFSAGDNIGYADGPTSSELCRILAEKKIPSVTGNHEAWSPKGKLFLGPPGAPLELTEEAQAFCRALPYRIRIEAAAARDLKLTLVHTVPEWNYVSPENARGFSAEEDADVIFCGHTHRPAIYTVAPDRLSVENMSLAWTKPVVVPLEPGKRYIADAGSLARPNSGRKATLGRGTYAALDLVTRKLEIHAFSKKKRIEELMKMVIEENTKRARAGEPPLGG